MSDTILYAALVSAVLALLLAFYYARWVIARPPGNERSFVLLGSVHEFVQSSC